MILSYKNELLIIDNKIVLPFKVLNMNIKSTYTQLFQAYGISSSYKDAFGNIHEVPFDTKIQLLKAIGVDINNQKEMNNIIHPSQEKKEKNILPPIIIHQNSLKTCHIPLNLPPEIKFSALHWSLKEEKSLNLNEKNSENLFSDVQQKNLLIKSGRFYKNKLILPDNIKPGYYELEITTKNLKEKTLFLVTVDKCYIPKEFTTKKRIWGLSIQLYAIRSFRNWGMGDFTDLLTLVKISSQIGANIIGINPLHALYPGIPEHISPYSPSSRQFLNTLYIDVEAIPEFKECINAQSIVQSPEFQSQLKYLRSISIIDYDTVHKLKHKVLSAIYEHFHEHHIKPQTKRAHEFHNFQKRNKKSLEKQSLFDTLNEHFRQQSSNLWSWPAWPKAFRNPKNKIIQKFTLLFQKRIIYFQYLQWIADEQLKIVHEHSKKLGLNVGLYRDIAVGTDIGGCEVWSHPPLYGSKVKIGCPPDIFNQKGQDWGLPPWNPVTLHQQAYKPFINTLRSNMRYSGAIRLDHAMGLMRLFWVPENTLPTRGGYVSYPFENLLNILALESQLNKCLVIGEDLGTVPKNFRNTLQKHNILSYKVMLLETNANNSFILPKEYPPNALITFSTHDLPTLNGFWTGHDLYIRSILNLYPNEKIHNKTIIDRIEQRSHLASILQKNTSNEKPTQKTNQKTNKISTLSTQDIGEIQLLLANSPCFILMIQIEDILGMINQTNIPGTTNQYPNWRNKIPLELEIWTKDKQIRTLFSSLSKIRP